MNNSGLKAELAENMIASFHGQALPWEKRCQIMAHYFNDWNKNGAPPLSVLVEAHLDVLAVQSPAMASQVVAFQEFLNELVIAVNASPQHAFHNTQHICEAFTVAVALSCQLTGAYALSPEEKMLLCGAVLAHDLDRPGGFAASNYKYEIIAINKEIEIACDCGIMPAQFEKMAVMILGTYPFQGLHNIGKLALLEITDTQQESYASYNELLASLLNGSKAAARLQYLIELTSLCDVGPSLFTNADIAAAHSFQVLEETGSMQTMLLDETINFRDNFLKMLLPLPKWVSKQCPAVGLSEMLPAAVIRKASVRDLAA